MHVETIDINSGQNHITIMSAQKLDIKLLQNSTSSYQTYQEAHIRNHQELNHFTSVTYYSREATPLTHKTNENLICDRENLA